MDRAQNALKNSLEQEKQKKKKKEYERSLKKKLITGGGFDLKRQDLLKELQSL